MWWGLGRRLPDRWAIEEGAEADRWAGFRRTTHVAVGEGERGNGSLPRGSDQVDGNMGQVCGSSPLRKGKGFRFFI
jgi:hypothetical protein